MDARVVLMTGTRTFEMGSVRVPASPPLGGAIIRVLVNGLCGSDYDLYSGRLERAYESVEGSRPIVYPLIPGHEMLGEIVAIDESSSTGFAPGDRVVVEPMVRCGRCSGCLATLGGSVARCADPFIYSMTPLRVDPGLWGGMAEYMVVRPNSQMYKVPDGISDLDATLSNPLGNAFHWAFEKGDIAPGHRVLVLGHGQRGLMCAVVAREAGAAQVIVAGRGRSRHKLRLAPLFGATDVVDVEQEPVAGTVRRITSGLGVDLIVDTVPGSSRVVGEALDALRPGGRLVLAGVKGDTLELSLDRIMMGGWTVTGAGGTTTWSTENALRVIAEGRYPWEQLHSHVLDLGDAERAVQILGGEVDSERPVHVALVP